MKVYDNGEVTAEVVDDLVTIVVTKKFRIHLLLEELADIGEAVARYLESAAEGAQMA